MGLDVGEAHWSYGGFNRFRERIAAAEGIPLPYMAGHEWGDDPPGKPWDDVVSDLVPLLNHSDCDGELTPEECARVAPRLREVVSVWREDDYDRKQAMLLIAAMNESIASGEPLEFQ